MLFLFLRLAPSNFRIVPRFFDGHASAVLSGLLSTVLFALALLLFPPTDRKEAGEPASIRGTPFYIASGYGVYRSAVSLNFDLPW